MWKVLVAFIVFAAAALFLIFKAGDKVDMQGEAGAHNPTEVHAAPASEPAAAPAPVAAPAPASAPDSASK
ncbi:hypothetical protein [Undibacterium luofuense]|jgi:hypothetical protein|uniref:Uncharacterized protein n=1 Tax=Undibacterium luofuense TaxID=2828733 RepID=A0A941I5S7_9BURK|nr:hypothetical protein [Undibacterium luofuense]MBR7783102.1 hypothetical protein [Undibacterium luofuense]